MSIYHPRFKRPIGHDDVTQNVKHGSAHAPSGARRVGPESARDWTLLRKVKPLNYMLASSMQWLTSLPKEVRPWALVRQYPRIANLLAALWSNPATCAAYFHSLLIDHRHGKRKGFPADVHRELRKLQNHYHRQHLTLAE
jgi:hypothetical protein